MKKMLYEKHDGYSLPLACAKQCWDFTQKVISDNVACGYTIGDAWKNATAYQGRWYNPPPRKPAGAEPGNQGGGGGGGGASQVSKKMKLQQDDPAEYVRSKAQSERDAAAAKQRGSGNAAHKGGKAKGGKGKRSDKQYKW